MITPGFIVHSHYYAEYGAFDFQGEVSLPVRAYVLAKHLTTVRSLKIINSLSLSLCLPLRIVYTHILMGGFIYIYTI